MERGIANGMNGEAVGKSLIAEKSLSSCGHGEDLAI